MAIIKRDFYFIGFGNMAQAIYQRMDKKSYKNIFLIEKSNQRIKEIKEMSFHCLGNFKLSPQTQIIKKLSKSKFHRFDAIFNYCTNRDVFRTGLRAQYRDVVLAFH